MSPSIRAELKQARPFASLEHEAVVSLARTVAVLEHQMAEVLKPYGLTPTQYNVLRILRGAGEEGLCRNEVRDRMISPMPDATRLLDRLADMGLLVRSRTGDDRRFVRTQITAEGIALLARLDDVIHGLHERQLGHLGEAELRRLLEILEHARERR
ncbi:MAG TPA: MarR family transcriptional regulator [Gemmatimonadales bacterium]